MPLKIEMGIPDDLEFVTLARRYDGSWRLTVRRPDQVDEELGCIPSSLLESITFASLEDAPWAIEQLQAKIAAAYLDWKKWQRVTRRKQPESGMELLQQLGLWKA